MAATSDKMTGMAMRIMRAQYTVDLGDGLVKVIPLRVEFRSDGKIEILDMPEEIAALPRNPLYQPRPLEIRHDEEEGSFTLDLDFEDRYLGFEELKARWRRELYEIGCKP